MYLPLPIVVAWLMVTGLYTALSFYRRGQLKKKSSIIRKQRRTIEKLKKTNGKIWYELARKEESQLNEVELTATSGR